MPRQLWNSMLNSSAYQTLIIQVLNYSNNSRTKYIPTRSKLQSTYFTSRVSIFDSSHHPCLAFIAQTVTLTSTDSWYLTAPPSEDIVMARFWNYMALSRTCPHPEAPHITSNLAEYIREGELKMISIQFISIARRVSPLRPDWQISRSHWMLLAACYLLSIDDDGDTVSRNQVEQVECQTT